MTVMKIVCAWCGKPMGEKDGQGQEGISHGMCEECHERLVGGNPGPRAEKNDKNMEVKHDSD